MRSGLLTLYRSLTLHRLYSILNVGGLALGIAVFLVLFLFVLAVLTITGQCVAGRAR